MAINNEALNNVQISPRYTGDSQLDKFQQDLILEVDKLKKSLNPSVPDKSTEEATPAFQVTPATAVNPIGDVGPIFSTNGQYATFPWVAGASEYSLPTGCTNAIQVARSGVYAEVGTSFRWNHPFAGYYYNYKIYAGKIYINSNTNQQPFLFWCY